MPKTTSSAAVDFEKLSALAASDPDAFESLRADLIEEQILRAPPERQQRLRCLQWRIDQIRRSSRTPLAACIRISQMMWDSVTGPGGLQEALNQACIQPRSQPAAAISGARTSATVIPFRTERH